MKSGDLPKANWSSLMDKAFEQTILTTKELVQVKTMLKMVDDVIQTDEFDDYALGPKNAHPDWQKAKTEV
jgi:acyl-CoA dehydrogenase